MDKNTDQFMRLFQAFALIKETKVLENISDSQMLKLLLYCDSRGWLYYKFDGIKILLVGCAYNIHEGWDITKLPQKSEGKIMFIPFVASRAEDKNILRRMLVGYLRNNPETESIMFYKDDAEERTIFNRKGVKSGKKQLVTA